MPNATFVVGSTTVTFGLLIDGAHLERSAAMTARHIPTGDVTYVDFAGLNAPTFPCRGRIDTYADLVTLQGLCGQVGTLTYSVAVHSAILEFCKQSRVMRGDGFVRFADLLFHIDAP